MLLETMKTKHLLPLALVIGLLSCVPLHAQLFVTTGTGFFNTTVNEYTTSGAPVGSGTLVSSGLNNSPALAVSGGDIFVTSRFDNAINEYTTSGAPVGSGVLVSSGLSTPYGIAISGTDIFVVNNGNNTIGEYTTAGDPVGSGTLVSTGLSAPRGIAVSGGNIFVTSGNAILEFTLAGAPVGSGTLVSSGLNGPMGIAISGTDVFVTNFFNSTIGEYTTSGSTVNASLISVSLPDGIAVIPEPSAWSLLAMGGAALLGLALRRRVTA